MTAKEKLNCNINNAVEQVNNGTRPRNEIVDDFLMGMCNVASQAGIDFVIISPLMALQGKGGDKIIITVQDYERFCKKHHFRFDVNNEISARLQGPVIYFS